MRKNKPNSTTDHLQAIADSTTDALIAIDHAGNVISWNAAAGIIGPKEGDAGAIAEGASFRISSSKLTNYDRFGPSPFHEQKSNHLLLIDNS